MPRGGDHGEASLCRTLGCLLRLEAKLSSFGFRHPNPRELAWPQWSWMQWICYVVHRIFIAALFLTSLIIEIPFDLQRKKSSNGIWFIFATNWSLLFTTFTHIGFAVYSTYYTINRDKKQNEHGSTILWFFYNLCTNCMIVTSGVYWISLWDGGNAIIQTEEFLNVASRLKHSVPAAILIFDIFLNNMPIRILHCIYPCVVGILYSIFSYIYWVTELPGLNQPGIIYPALNWNNPVFAACACLLAVVFCIAVQLFLFTIYFLRIFASLKLNGLGNSLINSKGDIDGNTLEDGSIESPKGE